MRKISFIKILYPELMSGDASTRILSIYDSIERLKDYKNKLFLELNNTEKEIKELEEYLHHFDNLYEVKYEKGEQKEEIKGESPCVVESNGTIHI